MDQDIVCFSHLRWNFVFQRPNHLMVRAARRRRVYYVEEPVAATDSGTVRPHLDRREESGVTVVTPVVPAGLDADETDLVLDALMDQLFRSERIVRPVLWYYTPMALQWTRRLPASAIVYDCMDYLAGFRGAPRALLVLEDELVRIADVVFTGGARLHTRMAGRHPRAFCFPSSVDRRHFARARTSAAEPAPMSGLGRPRVGYAGVIDERLDLELIAGVAAARPDWEIVLVGPVAKIDASTVPAAPNIHAVGLISYNDLPDWLGSWDVGWMPFAHNEATRYISPTKTPEYLAAGLAVVSTSIHDVVEPYGHEGLVLIADDVEATVAAMDAALAADPATRVAAADRFLATMSWDRTWEAMAAIVEDATGVTAAVPATSEAGAMPTPHRGAASGPASGAGSVRRGGSASLAERA